RLAPFRSDRSWFKRGPEFRAKPQARQFRLHPVDAAGWADRIREKRICECDCTCSPCMLPTAFELLTWEHRGPVRFSPAVTSPVEWTYPDAYKIGRPHSGNSPRRDGTPRTGKRAASPRASRRGRYSGTPAAGDLAFRAARGRAGFRPTCSAGARGFAG